jgi:D-arabinose 1-dehydrogenase-like Zn-dependent alcohol dehydrogenase
VPGGQNVAYRPDATYWGLQLQHMKPDLQQALGADRVPVTGLVRHRFDGRDGPYQRWKSVGNGIDTVPLNAAFCVTGIAVDCSTTNGCTMMAMVTPGTASRQRRSDMVETMRAQRFYADSKEIAVEDVPIPELGQGEVLVKVAFCGICHSDLSLINGTFPSQQAVVTQGHEASGTIAKLGPGVIGWSEGDRVVVAAGRPCLECVNCRRGDVSNCLRIRLMAFAYDGAWAEYTVAQAFGLTRVPDNVTLEHAAILADAVSTPYGAVVRTGKVGIGESVGVWGVGGVGTHVVQLARLVGAAPIIAVDIKPAVLDRALAVGADYAFDARDDALHDKIAEATEGRQLDVAFDAVGLKSTFEQALGSLTVGGRLVGIGMSADAPTIGPTAMFNLFKRQVLGHLGYQNADIGTLANLVSRGRLDLSRSISEIVSLEDVAKGIEKLEKADGDPIRILVQP